MDVGGRGVEGMLPHTLDCGILFFRFGKFQEFSIYSWQYALPLSLSPAGCFCQALLLKMRR